MGIQINLRGRVCRPYLYCQLTFSFNVLSNMYSMYHKSIAGIGTWFMPIKKVQVHGELLPNWSGETFQDKMKDDVGHKI